MITEFNVLILSISQARQFDTIRNAQVYCHNLTFPLLLLVSPQAKLRSIITLDVMS